MTAWRVFVFVGMFFALFSCGKVERKRAELRGGDSNQPVTEQELKNCLANDVDFSEAFLSKVYFCAKTHNGMAYDYCRDLLVFSQRDCTFRLRTVSYQTQSMNTPGYEERDLKGQWLINADNTRISFKDQTTKPQKLNFKILETIVKDNKTYLVAFEIALPDQSKVWVYSKQTQQ